MRIVTFNANGLRARVQQFGSLRALLSACGDADVVCIQEIKLIRQDVKEDVAVAPGFEAVFSFNRVLKPRRTGYSGVATFFRISGAHTDLRQHEEDSEDRYSGASWNSLSSNSQGLPLHSPLAFAAEDGFTGLLAQPPPWPSNSALFVNSVARPPSSPPSNDARADHVLGWIAPEDWEALGFDLKELKKVDSEGRCVITHHATFVLFNIYVPRVPCGDEERLRFKLLFLQALQTRFQRVAQRTGKAVIVAGDFNIVPGTQDSSFPSRPSESGPDPCQQWLRRVLGFRDSIAEKPLPQTGVKDAVSAPAERLLATVKAEAGGRLLPLSHGLVEDSEDCGVGWDSKVLSPMADIFRTLHPNRREAYTCWSQATGAEEFNFGCRIDLFLAAGPCQCAPDTSELVPEGRGAPAEAEAEPHGPSSGHCIEAGVACREAAGGAQKGPQRGHSFLQCEVEGCDILLDMRRKKGDTLPRWMNGRTLRLEGSDHAPVFLDLRAQRLPSRAPGATDSASTAAFAANGIPRPPSSVSVDSVVESPAPPATAEAGGGSTGGTRWDERSWRPPPLAARFMLEIRGRQQSLRSLLPSSNANCLPATSLPPPISLLPPPSSIEPTSASRLPATGAPEAADPGSSAIAAPCLAGPGAAATSGEAVSELRGTTRAPVPAPGASRQQKRRPRGPGGLGAEREQSRLLRFFRPTSRTGEVQEPCSASVPQGLGNAEEDLLRLEGVVEELAPRTERCLGSQASLNTGSLGREGGLLAGNVSDDRAALISLEENSGMGGAVQCGPIQICSSQDKVDELSEEGVRMPARPTPGSTSEVLENTGPGLFSPAGSGDTGGNIASTHEGSTGSVSTRGSTASQWMQIRRRMEEAVPKCKGHREACVFRVVKKAGPSIGRGFYVCARAKGPASNLEARCDHFQWAAGAQNGRSRPKL